MSISLLCVTSIHHDLSWFAVNKSAQVTKFDRIIVLSDQLPDLYQPFSYAKIPAEFNLVDYNVMIMKNLDKVVDTDHVLVVQYDGMATNAEFWSDEFLEYDYVGPAFSPWRHAVTEGFYGLPEVENLYQNWPRNRLVSGSGGFSLRSRRLIQALCEDPEIQCPWGPNNYFVEDVLINFVFRERLIREHGIKFAPLEVAIAFGAEHVRNHGLSLGFHGWYNAPYFLTDNECVWYYHAMASANKVGFSPQYMEWFEAEYAAHASDRRHLLYWMDQYRKNKDPNNNMAVDPRIVINDSINYG